MTAKNHSVLVFDSGLGGLTVLREIARQRPDLVLSYAADDAAFPYGRLADDALVERVVTVMGRLIESVKPDLAVIACNTASTLALPALRAKFSIPFVGTVPAIKPACERSETKRVSVLATAGTVKREYTQALIRQYGAGCEVKLVGSPNLATLAEAVLRGEAVAADDIRAELSPCFVDGGSRTDTVVLACTHYPLILDQLEALAPWPVTWIDPADAIARRASSLLGEASEPGEPKPGVISAYFTSGREPSEALIRSLALFRAEAVKSGAFLVPV
ncbi:MAG TPA: glutamate racemase [Xanthobacteraceae bacterium]|nr:glutamate racemase [Xanthobacteraceae bacterium]